MPHVLVVARQARLAARDTRVSRDVAVTYRVGVVDVTDGKTFANLTTVRFG